MKKKKKEDIPPPIKTDKSRFSYPAWLLEAAIIVVVSLIISILMYPNLLSRPKIYKVGDIADRNIKASTDLLVEDIKLTNELREKAVRAVKDVYDFDPTASHLIKRIRKAFAYAREELQVSLEEEDIEKVKKKFFDILYLNPNDSLFKMLYLERFSPELEERLVSLLKPLIEKGIVADKKELIQKLRKGIILHNIITGNEMKVTDINSFYDLSEAQKIISKNIQIIRRKTGNLRFAQLIKKMAILMLKPNITFNSRETELRKQIAKRSVKPSYFKIKKGEMLVREGEKITSEDLLKLKAQYKALKKEKGIGRLIAMFVLLCSMMGVTYFIGSISAGKRASYTKDLVFSSLILFLVFVTVLFSNFIAEELSKTFHGFSSNAIRFAIPVASGPMLICIFLGISYAIGFSFIASVLSAIVLKGHIEYFIYFFVTSLLSVYGVRNCRERIVFIKTGFKVGLLSILLALSVEAMLCSFTSIEIGVAVVSAFMGGILTGIITTGSQPLIESIFGYTTDIKLLELANLDQPLLQELMVRAPGTYHHSVIVSNMVEAAAHEIGANPLLAKVAAYYHDIGKMKKPLYFIENQIGTENKHEKLAPSMSALILISHVKEGVEIAKRHKLGQEIIDIIQQHHGTSLISYFYEKAKAQAEKSEKAQPVNEEDFRYPGPKPQTKEAGLVMLADSVEAACRSLSDPTPARIKGTVQNIINKIFADGQLDECELTLKDLNKIARSFNKTLSGIFHHRIEYPEPAAPGEQKKRVANETSDKIRKADTRDKEKESKEEDKNGLRRLGMSR